MAAKTVIKIEPMRVPGTLGRIFLGVAITAFGVLYLLYAHMANPHVIGPPFFPEHRLLAWVMGAIFFAAGAGIAAGKGTRLMAALAGSALLAQIVIIHAPRLAMNLHDPGPWTSGFEVVGICSGAWALASGLLPVTAQRKLLMGLRIGFGSLLVVVGVQHFMYAQFVATLVQRWMPWHLFWAYFVGVAFFATALALVTGKVVRLATAMLGLMFFLFVTTLHIPRVAAASHNGSEWTSLFVALAMCGTSWIFAADATSRGELRRTA